MKVILLIVSLFLLNNEEFYLFKKIEIKKKYFKRIRKIYI
jgi:hypothetical protein